jgi:LemA protein
MVWWLWLIIAIVVLVILMFIYYYNKIVVLFNRIKNSFSQIDVQLKRRNDLVPNLVSTVKGYAKHEKSVLMEVTKARTSIMNAGNFNEKMQASDTLSNALKSIFAVAESYPDLKANTNFLHLQQELSDIESKIAYSRQFYNDSVLVYNNTVTTFPGVIFAGIYGKKETQYLETAAAERKNVKVEF